MFVKYQPKDVVKSNNMFLDWLNTYAISFRPACDELKALELAELEALNSDNGTIECAVCYNDNAPNGHL